MKTTLPKSQVLTHLTNVDTTTTALLPSPALIPLTHAVKMPTSLPQQQVLNTPVTALKFDQATRTILRWAHGHESKAVCVANVHMLMEARGNKDFDHILNNADMVTPDGMPLVWMMKLLGRKSQNRVAGMELLQSLCQQASEQKVKVFFLGSHKAVLDQMRTRLETDYPNLEIAGMEPLPFRSLTSSEDDAVVEQIRESGAGLVFVCLGCPKQEKWIADHKGRIPSVMIGLGGAFPVYAGLKKWAPRWVRQSGLEWLYRLSQEPKRLVGRYSQTIPPFIFLAFAQLLSHHFTPRRLRNNFTL